MFVAGCSACTAVCVPCRKVSVVFVAGGGVVPAGCGAVVSVPAGCVFAAGWCLLYSWLVLAAVPAAEGR